MLAILFLKPIIPHSTIYSDRYANARLINLVNNERVKLTPKLD